MNKQIIILMITVVVLLASCTTKANTGAATVEVDINQKIILGINGGEYTPNPIVVEANRPVTFIADRTLQGCSPYIVQPELGINANLAQNKEYTFTPTKKGKYTLTCSMQMFKGTIEVI